ncbi:MAG: rhodanese-like domain-containing protein [Pseudomonadota bacterium]
MAIKGVKELVAEANTKIECISAEDAMNMADKDDVTIIDIRDVRELYREGKIPGAVHAPRGMLEFWFDPASPYHKEVFATGNKMVLHCASGWRSALAALTLQEMGFDNIAHIDSGYKGWKDAGGVTEVVEKK